ncbi:hypothetical protein KH5_19740 [Urechidicola sp. KH5]
MHTTNISIIVPCYNQSEYLKESLTSVLEQNYNNWECIIVNDGSTDASEEIANLWVEKDSRFKYISIKNGGLSNARNLGIAAAKSNYILPLDADDKISKDYVQLALKAFECDNQLKVVYCKAKKFGMVNELWNLAPFSLKSLATTNMIFCSAIFRKADWKSIGGYDINMLYGLEDWEFWISLLKNGGKVKQLDEIGFYYRIKESSMITNLTEDKRQHLYNYVSIKHADFYVNQFGSFQELLRQRFELKKMNRDLSKDKKHALKVLIKSLFK